MESIGVRKNSWLSAGIDVCNFFLERIDREDPEMGETATVNDVMITAILDLVEDKARVSLVARHPRIFTLVITEYMACICTMRTN